MKKSITIGIAGALLAFASSAIAGPPARRDARDLSGVYCTSGCVANVGSQLTRATLYGTVVPRCHQETATNPRWGSAQKPCPGKTLVACK